MKRGKSKNEKWNFRFTRRIEEVLKMKQKVSLWLGNFASQEEFQEYFKISYKEDGDSVSSEFETDFHLSYYDRDYDFDYSKEELKVSNNGSGILEFIGIAEYDY